MINRMVSASAFFLLVSCGESGSGGLSGTGVSGSTTRFAVVGDHLYVLNQYKSEEDGNSFRPLMIDSLDTFSLENRETPTRVDRFDIDRTNPETLHAVGQNLFIGTSSGMQIVSLANPAKPDTLSFTSHFTSRDPVVVEGTTAYVTLRTGESESSQSFSSFGNELQIYNVEDLENPVQLSTFEMTAPWGIGVRHNRAYICDGSAGLRVLTVENPQQVKEVAAVNTDICFDVIATENLLVSTGAAGVTQYKIDAATDAPAQLSTIALQQ